MVVGLGVDLVEVERMGKLLLSYTPEKLLRIFTDKECEYSYAIDTYERFAVRFAMKEAFFKAFGMGIFFEIECAHLEGGKPSIRLYGKTQEEWEKRGKPDIMVSLSHTKSYAIATVLIQEIDKKD